VSIPKGHKHQDAVACDVATVLQATVSDGLHRNTG
jgi:hypothetical protein